MVFGKDEIVGNRIIITKNGFKPLEVIAVITTHLSGQVLELLPKRGQRNKATISAIKS